MKHLIKSTCIAAVVACSLPGIAAAGNWASATQGQNIIANLRGTNDNTIEVGENVKDLEHQVEDSLAELGDRVIAALRGHSGEQSAYQDKQIEANRRITDAAEQNATERMRQEFRAKAESGEYDPNPNMCLLAGILRASNTAVPGNTGSDMAEEVSQELAGGDPAVRAGGSERAKAAVDEREELAGAMGGFADPTTDVAAIVQNPTITLETEEDRRAYKRLVRNLVNPFPERPITASELQTPEGLARAEAEGARSTRNNATLETVAMITNMRNEVNDTEQWLPYIDDISYYNRTYGDQLSELQALDIRTLRYYAPSPETLAIRDAFTEKQMMSALIDEMAISNRLQYLALELDSRRAMVETQILSVLNNGS